MRTARSELGLAVSLIVIVALALVVAHLQFTATPAVQFQVVNLCNAPQTYVDDVIKYASDAYETYTRLFGRPPPFYGQIVLRGDMPQGIAGLTYITCGATGCWAYKIELACNLRNLDEVVYHEMAHAMQAAFISPSTQYDWYTEASAEGLAAYALRRATWLYQGYYFSKMWQTSPQELGDYSVRWYYYAAPMAWLIWRYGPARFAEWSAGNYTSYLLFLLSPWDWGRFLWAQEPNYENCGPWGGQISLKPYTGQYCQSLYSENGTAVASDLPVNATLRPPYLLLAFAAPTAAKDLFTVTPIPPATVTVTHTVPVTTTVTQTATKTETVTVTATQTVLVNTTITVPTTVTHTVTATATQTVTLTSPTTVTKNYTTTYTVTVTQPGISLDPTAAAVLSTVAVALLIAAIACSRCATKAQTPSS